MITSYINGTYQIEALISPFDLGLLRAYGVFESFRTHKKQPLFLKQRLERLYYSAKEVGIVIHQTAEEIEAIVDHLIQNNGFSESTVRIIVTKGSTDDGMTPLRENSLFILTTRFKGVDDHYYEKGVSAVTKTHTRFLPHVKSLNYLPALTFLAQAKIKGAQEILYLSDQQEILEGTTCNFFAFKGNTLITPQDNILLGITREAVLKQASPYFLIEKRSIKLSEIDEFEETFLTSSIKEIVPLISIDDQKIGSGIPGPKTKQLIDLFRTTLMNLVLD